MRVSAGNLLHLEQPKHRETALCEEREEILVEHQSTSEQGMGGDQDRPNVGGWSLFGKCSERDIHSGSELQE